MPTTTLRKMTPQERAQYEEDGFVQIPEVFPREELQAIDREVDRLMGTDTATGARNGEPLLRLGLRSSFMQFLCADERLLALVEDCVYPGIAIYSAKLTHKPPGHSQVCHWHQDDAYYVKKSQAYRRMSIWLALHDSDKDNGAVWFIPGSHKQGLRDHALAPDGMCRLSFEPTLEEQQRALCLPVTAGTVVLFSALTWHYSGLNLSHRLRRSFIVSYQEATAVAGNGEQWKILRPA